VDEEEPLARSQKRKDFGVGVKSDSKPSPIPSGDGFLERPVGIEAGVMMVVRMANGLPESIQEVLGRGYVRVSQTQVDHVASLFPHFGQAHVHFRAQITLK
jgi:hypothetical protein